MAPKRKVTCENQQELPMVIPRAPETVEKTFRPLPNPLWTENKAKLIERYLYYFVLITKHGTYIDGFAGPQEPDKPEMWAANLVLANRPAWMRHFYLYDLDENKVLQMEELKRSQPIHDDKGRKISRSIIIERGDFNELVEQLLASEKIKQKEATFCLLDQRTFECKWSTVRKLAGYKKSGVNKIELFYFLPNSWLDRALAGLTRNPHVAAEWWGEKDVKYIRSLTQVQRRDIMVERFKNELGYKYATPWPIYEKARGRGSIMYYMIHATDHEEAPSLMERAYHSAVKPKEPVDQLPLLFPELNPDQN